MRANSHPTDKSDYTKAQALRKRSSLIESKFWFALRNACRAQGLKFRRQQPIHPYVVDFACMKAKFLIELDGLSHDTRQANDRVRDNYLRRQGYTILRINNEDVIKNTASVVETIVVQVKALLTQNA